jgi:hypothetical protein
MSRGLLIWIVIAVLFIGDAPNLGLEKLIALLFVLGMFVLNDSFMCLFRKSLLPPELCRGGI